MSTDVKDLAARLARECGAMHSVDTSGSSFVDSYTLTGDQLETLVRRAMVEALKDVPALYRELGWIKANEVMALRIKELS